MAQQTQLRKIQLKWIESTEVEVGKNFKVSSILVEDNFLDDNLNPSFSEIWDVPNGGVLQSFAIKNAIFEQISNVSQSIVNTEKISSNLL